MRILSAIADGLRDLAYQKLRSFVAILAIVLGVGSLMSTLALSAGMAASERRWLMEWGGFNRFSVMDRPLPPGQQLKAGNSPGLTYEDVLAIRRNAPLIQAVSPDDYINPNLKVTRGNKAASPYRPLSGDEDYGAIANMLMAYGRFLCAMDRVDRNRVCVIGVTVAEQLGLKPSEAVGENLCLNGALFRIVGVTSRSYIEVRNKFVFIPKSTAQCMFRVMAKDAGPSDPGEDQNTRLTEVGFVIADPDQLNEAIDQVRNILSFTHRGVQDFAFFTREDLYDQIEGRVRASQLTGLLTAAVSLVIGGVGVANVMLASIRQRIHEIGIRRAVGARGSDIFVQIISETIAMSVLGGVAGLGVGWGLLYLFQAFATEGATPILQWQMVALSFAAALIVGICSGVYPAWKGASLSPTEALRAE
jgi:putative ABC transport system permease protein